MIKLSGVDISKILVGNGGGASPATKIMIGTGSSAVQVWPVARKVVIYTRTTNLDWIYSQASGDAEILSFTTFSQIRFSVPVKCDRAVSGWSAGVTIPAEANITALVKDTTYTFTEAL
ncbi:hypothetical protein KW808_11890 [[Brevibacterium] flavum]|nr:hypothetical protein KW808_11890 [[Brevibacterium] flavum]